PPSAPPTPGPTCPIERPVAAAAPLRILPAVHPAHTIPPPRWVRRWVIYAIAPVYAVVIAILATRLGAWMAGVGLLVLIVAGAWISLSAERRERQARLRHLKTREPRPLA